MCKIIYKKEKKKLNLLKSGKNFAFWKMSVGRILSQWVGDDLTLGNRYLWKSAFS